MMIANLQWWVGEGRGVRGVGGGEGAACSRGLVDTITHSFVTTFNL
jgi:hypothetical protein